MKTKKEELIKIINDAPVDEFETVVLIAHGKVSEENNGTLCCIQGDNADLIATTCAAFEKSPDLLKYFMDCIKVFILGMRDKLSLVKDVVEKYTPEANA
jgi:hypothetical protein